MGLEECCVQSWYIRHFSILVNTVHDYLKRGKKEYRILLSQIQAFEIVY